MLSSKPLLVMFLGVPGSGKSYFAKQLTKKVHAVRVNGDSMRIAMFGSVENIKEIYNSPNKGILNTYTFGALDYAVQQILLHGDTVVYDAHHNRRSVREDLEKLADSCGAIAVVVSIKTP